ncbi:hypothetical protein EV127DRAFT_421282 [Xylaria flabelliformis]|nr:hypothetical protein EV127DRAFT_421282 [Xylaria flabelliformis]
MAPSSKGTNPAPNYTVTMNRVQTQIEAQLRIVRSFMPSRTPAAQQSTSSPAKPSFSALASTSTSKPATPSTFQSRQQTQKQDSESLFAETRAQDPNAGLGFGGSSSKRNSEREKERENQILRSRLLGRKRGAAGNVSGRTSSRREEESSDDEEPGRSGLGRAKKRVRREVSEEEKEGEKILSPGTVLEAPESAGSAKKVGATQSKDDNGALEEEDDGDLNTKDGSKIALSDDPVPVDAEGASEQKKSKKRKKKRKKNKSKDAEGE